MCPALQKEIILEVSNLASSNELKRIEEKTLLSSILFTAIH
ncbi:hypothetical protein SpAn4DRAFT_3230 [Sporomusa ovata]|uniref:Uncharacterized protein n=1 Tax=Sporomusa ovata TaxID=2378 RepID=A0A0U1KZC0_9FIRM|nr:hypothetical protein SpAn4DRAFT_3230 [Sporomusa ovata]